MQDNQSQILFEASVMKPDLHKRIAKVYFHFLFIFLSGQILVLEIFLQSTLNLIANQS